MSITAKQRISVHMFTGGCGDVLGALQGGLTPGFGANHHPASVATARLNFPGMTVREADVQNLNMHAVPGAPVLIASPICTDATPNNGKVAPRGPVELDAFGMPKPGTVWEQTRITMWEPVRYASVHRPLVYAWENVPEFGLAPLFDAWNYTWDRLGYVLTVGSVNAAHVKTLDGAAPPPQSRDRIVGMFVRKDVAEANGLPDLAFTCDAVCPGCGPVQGVQYWKNAPALRIGSYGRRRQYVYVCPGCAAEVEPVVTGIETALQPEVRGEPFGLGYFRGRQRVKRTAYGEGTRRRVAVGLERYRGEPFIVTLRNHCDASDLTQPIGTLSAQGGGHHYLARPTVERTVDSVEYRPLTLREKARCQAFPDSHEFAGTPADQRLQIGNAVPVNVAAHSARSIAAVLPGPVASPGTVDLRLLRTAAPDDEEAA